jgi:hypothetical protein
MKMLGEFKCLKCGWVHAGIAEADAVDAVAGFNSYLTTLSPDARTEYGADPSAGIYFYEFRHGQVPTILVVSTFVR